MKMLKFLVYYCFMGQLALNYRVVKTMTMKTMTMKTMTMDKIRQDIWSPWEERVQEEALDLTVKKEQKEEHEKVLNQFDFAKFYQTYSLIAQREFHVKYQTNTNFTFNSNLQKEPCEPVYKRRRMDKNSEAHSDEIEPTSIASRAKYEKSDKSLKKSKKKISGALSKIKDTRDCRFCYEDHIIRMRLKTYPYLS